MNIMWLYLDKRAAAVKAIKDYAGMQYIIDHTEEDIRRIHADMDAVSGPDLEGMPTAGDPKAGEERVLKAVEQIDLLQERYRQAMEYMAWFLPAWNALSEEERYVLDVFYRDNGYGSGAADAVSRRFHIERASAYRRKDRALDKLRTLLYGRF